jgi:septum formation protein
MPKSQSDPLIILASESPRRKYLLEQAGLTFTVVASRFDEGSVEPTGPAETVTILAEAKADEVAARFPNSWVIGADTIVAIDGHILGKPDSESRAAGMLQQLSGRTHQVFTGFCVCCRSKSRHYCATVSTDVVFKELTQEEIRWYIQTREPFDKAGAYAIQGLGTFLVRRINGSYTNVVGLPVCEVIEYLIKEQVIGLNLSDTQQAPVVINGD